METWIILILLLLAVLILNFLAHRWSRRRFPPGPLSFPLIGSTWVIGTRLHKDTLIKLAKRYGTLYTMWLGNQPVVVLSGFKTVKEGMANFSGEFSDRMVTPFFTTIGRDMGLIFSNGHIWRQQRHIVVTSLRKLGLGKKSIEYQIQEGCRSLTEIFICTKGQPFDPSIPLSNVVINVICALCFGYQFALEDENFLKLIAALDDIVDFFGTFFHLLYELFPWLMRNIPGPHKKTMDSSDFIVSFAKREMEKHKNDNSLCEPQDFIDHYLLQIENSKHDSETSYNEENLAQCIRDLFLSGTETITITLQWTILMMANHPDIQEKIYKEMEDTFGSSSSISYQDRINLPYTNAVIHEILRIKYVLLFGVPRQSIKDVKMRGYHIPQGTIIVPDLHSVLFDPEEWETPEKFNPNHFLDQDGNFKTREAFLPFGKGSRACLGEQLARAEIFIILTSLLRTFVLQLPEGVKKLNDEPIITMTLHPHPFRICAIPRQTSQFP